MKKFVKHLLKSLISITVVGLVTSCDNSISPISEDGFYRVEELTNTVKDAQESIGYDTLFTTGTQKLLVVPVEVSNGLSWTESMLNELNIAFFGDADETNYWESVKSYYEIASYGNFILEGEVTDVLKLSNYTISSLNNQINRDGDIKVVFDAFYNQADASLLKEYDQDNNGHIDACAFIYSNSYDYDSNYWAWVWFPDNGSNVEKPVVSNYMWASYDFMHDDSDNGIDAHTYIHEFGHMLGLDDLYSTESYDPVGMLEMQSYNVGDQSAFCKLQLDWLKPYYVDGTEDSVEITIGSSALYGDAILINDNWNGGSEDEYILIEYYTPDGNNYLDSQNEYYGSSLYKMYTESGLRIYHVDARLAKLDSNGRFISYSDAIYDDGYVYFPGASNISSSWSYLDSPYDTNFKLVEIIQANVSSSKSVGHVKNGGYLNNNSLFGLGDVFTPSSAYFYYGTKFNNGNTIGYTVEMVEQTDETATVRIAKI